METYVDEGMDDDMWEDLICIEESSEDRAWEEGAHLDGALLTHKVPRWLR